MPLLLKDILKSIFCNDIYYTVFFANVKNAPSRPAVAGAEDAFSQVNYFSRLTLFKIAGEYRNSTSCPAAGTYWLSSSERIYRRSTSVMRL